MGKIGHGKVVEKEWSEPYYVSAHRNPYVLYWQKKLRNSWEAVSEQDRKLHPIPDDLLTAEAVKQLQNLASRPSQYPFYLSVGYFRPHAPRIFPAKFLEYYPTDQITRPEGRFADLDLHELAISRQKTVMKKAKLKGKNKPPVAPSDLSDLTLDWRRAYYCSVSYLDSLIGRLLEELDRLDLSRNTIVALWSDHGYSLGEHEIWGKNILFDSATKVPMLIRVPGRTDEGIRTDRPAELVDLFPTLVESAGLPLVPRCPPGGSTEIATCHEGQSLASLMYNTSGLPAFSGAFSQVKRGRNHIGYSVRAARFRYTEWVQYKGNPADEEKWSYAVSRELYDYQRPVPESQNLAGVENYRKIEAYLRTKLHSGWSGTNNAKVP